ncbi:MAG TPA: CHAD domain-containing protein [Pirellulales bacterium]|jgi:CHAD domain-containing protein|nr:CHAD domain-containing protein [Pirellulales bacterium]
MASQLKLQESGTQGMRRIVLRQLDKALESLEAASPIDDETVHGVRRRLKKARAGLRLLRKALGRKGYHRENSALRDAARPLTDARDAKILVDTLDKLRDEVAPKIGDAFDQIRSVLTRRQDDVRRAVLERDSTREKVVGLIQKVIDRADDWSTGRHGWSVLGDGIERTYRSARKALAGVREDRSVENLHEWRKQTKYLRYQLEFLEPVWPLALEDMAKDAHKLGGALGDDHDLAVLRETLDGQPDQFTDRIAVAAIFASIDRQRGELEERAMELGEHLYAEKTSEVLDRFESCWHRWRANKAMHI